MGLYLIFIVIFIRIFITDLKHDLNRYKYMILFKSRYSRQIYEHTSTQTKNYNTCVVRKWNLKL